MNTYEVFRKADGEKVYSYDSDAPMEWADLPFQDFEHRLSVKTPYESTGVYVTSMTLTQTQWKRRFTQGERLAIRAAAAESPVLFDYIDLMNGADKIQIDDPDTVNAVNLLEQVGLIAKGRAQEILNG